MDDKNLCWYDGEKFDGRGIPLLNSNTQEKYTKWFCSIKCAKAYIYSNLNYSYDDLLEINKYALNQNLNTSHGIAPNLHQLKKYGGKLDISTFRNTKQSNLKKKLKVSSIPKTASENSLMNCIFEDSEKSKVQVIQNDAPKLESFFL